MHSYCNELWRYLAKKGLLTPNKTISISILPAIDPDIENINFLKDLENRMYSELNNII